MTVDGYDLSRMEEFENHEGIADAARELLAELDETYEKLGRAVALIRRVGQTLCSTQAVADFHDACDECSRWDEEEDARSSEDRD